MKHLKKFIFENINDIQKIENKKSINPSNIQIGTVIVFDNGNGEMRGIVAEKEFGDDIDYKGDTFTYDIVVYVNEENEHYNYTFNDIKNNILPSNLEEYFVSYDEIISIESNSTYDSIFSFFKKVKNNENDMEALNNLIVSNFDNNEINKIFIGDIFVSRDFVTSLYRYLSSIKKIKLI